MNPEQLSETIVDVLAALVADGAITLPDGVPTQVTVERPRQKGHGDYATNVALQLAKKAGTNPRAFADLVAERLRASDGISEVEVAGPGFLNVTVEAGAQGQVAADVVAAGESYGSSDAFAGEKINLEFVSANPTGPLHIGAVRWAAVGDALGRVFTFSGAEVTREYYFNDHGAQLDRFSSSLLAWAKGRPVPEDGYGGAYIEEIAKDVVAKRPEVLDLPEDEAQEVFRAEGARADVRRDQAVAPRLRGRLRRLLPREQPAPVGCRRARDRRGSPRWATPTRPTARCGCAPRSTATTRTA